MDGMDNRTVQTVHLVHSIHLRTYTVSPLLSRSALR
jgi:hypothetical protein